MDELTRERYPFPLPRRERTRRENSRTIAARRRILNGVDETAETLAVLEKDARLVEAIRRVA